ncbi:MAG: class I SAM-dependent methyltransferase [Nitrospirae bacterium]|nr:class I SAM-dependent methyltransferase [Nitrospirota bacterium]
MNLFVPQKIERYAADYTSPLSPLLEELQRETISTMDNAQMLTGVVEGRLLQMLVKISGAKRVFEIGTFTGFSALMMAEGLPEDGELITCEIDKERAAFARRYFKRSPHGKKIQLKAGPALKTLKSIPDRSIDFIFIDADKTLYPLYYSEGMRVLRKGGLIAADNVLWSGKVLRPDDDESRAIALFNDIVKNDSRAEKVFLPVRDGVYLIRKR